MATVYRRNRSWNGTPQPLTSGGMNASASLDIARDGALRGRVVADVKAASQTLRSALELGGTVANPQVRK